MRLARSASLLAVGVSAACTLTTSLDGLSGGVGQADAGAPLGDAAADIGAPLPLGPTCGDALVCAPETPAGFDYFVAAPGAGIPCPAGYNAAGTLRDGPTADPTQCSCTCGAAQVASCGYTFELRTGPDNACAAATQTHSGGSCGPSLVGTSVNDVRVTSTTPPTIGCQVIPKTVKPPVSYASTWTMCKVQVDPLRGDCAAGQLCLRDPGARFRVCVWSGAVDAGAVTCPPDYPNLLTGGTALSDDRGCGGNCECAAPVSCTQGGLQLWRQQGCSLTPDVSVPSDDRCTAIAAANYGSWNFAPGTPSVGACVATDMLQAAGAATIVPQTRETVCCR